MEEYVWEPVAPLTRIGVQQQNKRVVISHQFPEALEAAIANRFANTAQGFVCTSLMMPANDALALAALITQHVPEGAQSDDVFNLATATIDSPGMFVTVGIMRSLTDEERAQPSPPETYVIQKEEGSCRALTVVSFTKAHKIAKAIEGIAAEITRRLAERLPDPAR